MGRAILQSQYEIDARHLCAVGPLPGEIGLIAIDGTERVVQAVSRHRTGEMSRGRLGVDGNGTESVIGGV